MADWRDEILDFWFSELKPEDWYTPDPDTDRVIRERFGDLYESLSDNVPGAARTDPMAALAAVLLFDQFPRNMLRGTARAFGTDALAAELSRHAIAAGFDEGMTTAQKQFLYMPLMHAENLTDQERCVNLFAALGMEDGLKYAREHRDIIARFGRFPHRNRALGRQSTAAEIEFLTGANSYGQ